jgi:hypothetical protein
LEFNGRARGVDRTEMSLKVLDKPHRVAVIGICWLLVIVMGSISFYLRNDGWIIFCQTGIIVFAIYGFYLYMLFMYDYIKQQAWLDLQKELKELEKGE